MHVLRRPNHLEILGAELEKVGRVANLPTPGPACKG
jgi:hypothetical protein